MAFGWFKKKKDPEKRLSFDPSNTRLNQLVKGAFIDYDLKTWEVKNVFEYDWGDDFFSDEYQLATADETIYLHVEEEDGELHSTISSKINIHSLDGDIANEIIRSERAPMKISYEGEMYFRESESIGYYRNAESENWQELISWTYYDKQEKKIISIDRWGEEDFSASEGIVAEEFEFSNIIMP